MGKLFSIEPFHESRQVPALEHPLEGGGDLLVAILEPEQTIFEFAERREVIGCKDLPLDDGEVDFNLVQPTGMDRRVHGEERGPLEAEAIDRLLTAMARTIVHDPEDATGRTIRLLAHDLGDQTMERGDAGFRFTAAKDLGPLHVPGRQISPGLSPLVLMFDILGTVRGGGQGTVTSPTGLNARLLVGAQHPVVGRQGDALPDTFVEIQDAPGLLDKGGVARKNPAPKAPGTESITAQPAPKSCATNLRHHSLRQHFSADLRQGEARQGEASTVRKFTGQGFNLDDHAGGKSGLDARPEVPPQGPASAPHRSVCATC